MTPTKRSDTHSLRRTLLHSIVAVALSCASAATLAMPKAAEHEDAPVTSGADTARPKRSTVPAKPPVATKSGTTAKRPKTNKTSKASHSATPTKGAKSTHSRK